MDSTYSMVGARIARVRTGESRTIRHGQGNIPGDVHWTDERAGILTSDHRKSMYEGEQWKNGNNDGCKGDHLVGCWGKEILE